MERVKEFIQGHPEVLVAAALGLVAFNMFNLVGAVDLLHRARAYQAQWQLARSEALGG